jgi:hypothetical protein
MDASSESFTDEEIPNRQGEESDADEQYERFHHVTPLAFCSRANDGLALNGLC